MANADTRDKRGSAIAILKSWLRLEQNPAGAIGQAGRQFAAYSYTGILASAPSAAGTPPGERILIVPNRRNRLILPPRTNTLIHDF